MYKSEIQAGARAAYEHLANSRSEYTVYLDWVEMPPDQIDEECAAFAAGLAAIQVSDGMVASAEDAYDDKAVEIMVVQSSLEPLTAAVTAALRHLTTLDASDAKGEA